MTTYSYEYDYVYLLPSDWVAVYAKPVQLLEYEKIPRSHWVRPTDLYVPSGPSISARVDADILASAESINNRTGVDLLAFGKPAGDIFNPEHWVY